MLLTSIRTFALLHPEIVLIALIASAVLFTSIISVIVAYKIGKGKGFVEGHVLEPERELAFTSTKITLMHTKKELAHEKHKNKMARMSLA